MMGTVTILPLLTAVLGPFCLAVLLTWRFSRPSSFLYLLDHPNDRSLHSSPVPRTGGVAILVAICVFGGGALLAPDIDTSRIVWIGASMLLIAAVSFWDDLRKVPPAARLSVHFVAASVLVYGGFGLHSIEASVFGWTPAPLLGNLLVTACVVWVVNLYNFMDGIDGLAGGMGVVGFAAFAILGWTAGDSVFTLTSAVVASACGGFLLFNFPPARIFMGDVGSATIGLLAAALSLWGIQDHLFPLWVPLLIFSPFIVDATVTLLKRLLAGERVWEAHRNHYYQRIVRLGWGHKSTVVRGYALMFGSGMSAIWAIKQPVGVQLILLASWVLIYVVLIYKIERLGEKKQNDEAII